jgi:DNA-binding SARP family transcriptional activator/pimeloyl-ACP methyl ester carboxylesterase
VGLAFRLLGALQVLVDDLDVTPKAPKERALLALLILNSPRVVSVDRIVEELWPTLEPERARHTVQVRMADLRKLLSDGRRESRLEFAAPGYRLLADREEIDEHRFALLVERGRAEYRRAEVISASVTLREALGMWRGEPLANVPMSAYLESEVTRLASTRIDAIEDCIDAELACGSHQAVALELERLVTEYPLRERLWRQRAVALYRSGRQVEALRACQEIRRQLADDLGLEPGPALRDIERAMLDQRPELDWTPPSEVSPASWPAPQQQPPVRYARAPDGVSIAYQVAGDGPPDLIIIPGFTSHLDVWWEPWSGRVARRLMTFARLIVFDKRGTGLSDRPPESGLEEWMEDTRVVLDAVGSERAVVLGMSAGGTVAMMFAATHPERTRALVLYGAQPCYMADDDYSFGVQPAAAEAAVQNVASRWGSGVMFNQFCPSVAGDAVLRDSYARFQRASASPGAAASYLRSLLQMDVRLALPLINAPTLVLHAARDQTDPVAAARYVAARIRDAKLVELDSADHLIWLTDKLDTMVNEIEHFVQRATPNEEIQRVLATVLDVEVRPGRDAQAVVTEIERYWGRVVRCDDGVLATFDGPARAIRCASFIAARPGSGGTVRAGIHCGECELVGGEVGGLAVRVARRMTRIAPASGVVVSQTVRDLVVGSGIALTEYGRHRFEGTPGAWSAYLVCDEAGNEENDRRA